MVSRISLLLYHGRVLRGLEHGKRVLFQLFFSLSLSFFFSFFLSFFFFFLCLSFSLSVSLYPLSLFRHGKGELGKMLHRQICPLYHDSRILKHYEFLRPFFHHPNYIKINGNRPLFAMLRWMLAPCHTALRKLRELAKKDGFDDLYVIGGEKCMNEHQLYSKENSTVSSAASSASTVVSSASSSASTSTSHHLHPHSSSQFLSFYDAIRYYPFLLPNYHSKIPISCLTSPTTYWKSSYSQSIHYVSTVVSFDNTPRRNIQNSTIWLRSFSNLSFFQSFEYDLLNTLYYERCCFSPERRKSESGRFILLNAWNEWGEGMVLEPSKEYGYSYLESVLKVKSIMKKKGMWSCSSNNQEGYLKYYNYYENLATSTNQNFLNIQLKDWKDYH
jgi:hypothetical protein